MTTTTETAEEAPSESRTKELAILALPVLCRIADQCGTITYGTIAGLIGTHAIAMRFPLTYIWEKACLPMGLPELWTIVVDADREPSDAIIGLTWHYPKLDMPRQERRATWRAMVNAVHAYPWQRVMDEMMERLRRG